MRIAGELDVVEKEVLRVAIATLTLGKVGGDGGTDGALFVLDGSLSSGHANLSSVLREMRS